MWVEVRTGTGQVLYRRTLHDPVPQHTEVFEPEGRIRRVPYAPESGVFSVVVPVDARADRALVVAGPEVRFAQPGLRASPGEEGRTRELVSVPSRRG